MIREAKEEIGVDILEYQEMGRVRFIFPHKPKWSQSVTVYLVDKWVGEPVETEAIKPIWFKQDQLPVEQMWDDNPIWLPKVLAGEEINVTYLFGEDNKVLEERYDEPSN